MVTDWTIWNWTLLREVEKMIFVVVEMWVNYIELYIRTRGRIGLYVRSGRRPFSKLTKLASHSVCLCGHFVSWTNSIARAFNKKNLNRVFHIQRGCRMTRLSSCGPVAFVHEASLVRPLVLIYNSMVNLVLPNVWCLSNGYDLSNNTGAII